MIKLMTGELNPTKGQIKRNMHLKISRFTQHFEDKLDLTMTPLDFFKQKLMPEEPIEKIRSLLGRFGCSGPMQSQVMDQLSAGQKARIVFAIIAHEKPHLIMLYVMRAGAAICLLPFLTLIVLCACRPGVLTLECLHLTVTNPQTHLIWSRLMLWLVVSITLRGVSLSSLTI